MPKVAVAGLEYASEDLSDNEGVELASLRVLKPQMAKLRTELSV